MKFLYLPRNFRFRLCRRYDTPHLTESVHIKRKIVQFLMVSRYRRVNVMIESCELSDIIPYFFIRCMKNMCAVFMHVDVKNGFRINISGNMFSFVDDKDFAALFLHLMCEHGSEQSRANHQIIVLHHCSAA